MHLKNLMRGGKTVRRILPVGDQPGDLSSMELVNVEGMFASWLVPLAVLRPVQPIRIPPKIGRNAPCRCGSGVKSKYCCG